MSADAFYALYGIRRLIGADEDAAVTLLELRKHPIQIAARSRGLDVWWGRCADGDQHYVLLGKMIAKLGAENQTSARLDDESLQKLAEDVRSKLKLAGFEDTPALLFEFEIG
jgi:hypothetical protein